jgi:hypothetical protein
MGQYWMWSNTTKKIHLEPTNVKIATCEAVLKELLRLASNEWADDIVVLSHDEMEREVYEQDWPTIIVKTSKRFCGRSPVDEAKRYIEPRPLTADSVRLMLSQLDECICDEGLSD